MWFIIALGLAAFLFWRGNIRRGQRFVRAVYFLNELDNGATVDEANGRVAKLFTKHSTPDMDHHSIQFAMNRAQRWTNGKQLPWVYKAREKGLVIDSGHTQFDLSDNQQHHSVGQVLGAEVGQVVRLEITMEFTSTEHPISSRIFCDPYIAGFATHLVKLLGLSAGITKASPAEVVDFFQIATQTVVGQQYLEEYTNLDKESRSYRLGKKDAALYGQAVLTPDLLDRNDLLVLEAVELARKRSAFTADVSALMRFGANEAAEAEQVALIWAIKSLTLGKYVQQHYRAAV